MLLVAAKCLGGCMWVLPILTCVWIMSSCFVTYGIAVAHNHTFPDFPYISYTGTKVPERGIFTLTIAIGAVLLAANAEMQYLFIKKLLMMESRPAAEEQTNSKWMYVNRMGLFLGMASGLGLLFVACFQVDSMKPPHYFGAFLCFGMAMFYAWVQVGIMRKVRQMGVMRLRRGFRVAQVCQVVNSVASTTLFIIFAVSKTMYNKGRDAGMGTKWDTLRPVFLVSTISEWLLTLSVTMFLLTFIPGFRMFSGTRIDIDLNCEISPGNGATENGVTENGVTENGTTEKAQPEVERLVLNEMKSVT